MSNFDDNPFADPQAASPFSDPAIQRATQQAPTGNLGIDEYNPFENPVAPSNGASTGAQLPPDPAKRQQGQAATKPSLPAVMQPLSDPAQKAKVTAEELQKRQEELDRRAAELEAREEALRSGGFTVKQHNWPPLPSFCPVKPCFYQDISVDIPTEFQTTVRTMYYLWGFYALLLLVNIFGAVMLFHFDSSKLDVMAGSIVSFVLYVPLAFVGWFRPIYRAFRSDSSLNFMVFFLVFTVQVILSIVSTTGVADYGAIGVFTAIGAFGTSKFLGVLLSIIAACQGLFALACFVMLMRIHRLYRGTTASFSNAQAEFASGIMRNERVQQAAANIAADAARQTVQNQFSGSRY
ncbi:secretory carrier-associated membrane protein 1 [Galendromus occidentalis]|uniref:Secretory carrier-associated membrane protein n=1 Tax=Galendromus occidentalis TaxID=34638 RepID=A0AAJ7PAD1_9ACAR|nr:secretory carrier-associated membrane protein 1 [Galendromus occidentalis]